MRCDGAQLARAGRVAGREQLEQPPVAGLTIDVRRVEQPQVDHGDGEAGAGEDVADDEAGVHVFTVASRA